MECPWDGHSLLTGLRPRNAKECPMPTPKIRPRPSSPPAPIAAALDLSQPGERAAYDLLQRFCTGRWPQWRLLGLQREGLALHAAVEWRRCRRPFAYSVVQIALDARTLRWDDMPSALDARKVLTALAAPPDRKPASRARSAVS